MFQLAQKRLVLFQSLVELGLCSFEYHLALTFLSCQLFLQLLYLNMVVFLHRLELSRQLLNNLDSLFGIVFVLHNGLLFILLLQIKFLLQLNDLMGQSLKLLLVKIGYILIGELMLIAEFFNDFGELGILVDKLLDVLFEILVLSHEVLNADRVVE